MFLAWWHYALGRLDATAPPPIPSTRFPLLLLLVACVVVFGEELLEVTEPIPRGALRSAVFGGIPLSVVALALRPSAPSALGALLMFGSALPTGSWLSLPAVVLGYALLFAGLGEERAHLGLLPGDWRWWGPRAALALLLITIGASAAMLASPELAAFYPRPGIGRESAAGLTQVVAGVSLDLFGWELLFRALLLFVLARRFGVPAAILLQAVLFFLGHYDKPWAELLTSLPGGVIAGWFAWRARSFLPIYLLHLWQLALVNMVGFLLR